MTRALDFITPEDLAAKAGWSPRRVRETARRLGVCRIMGNRMVLTPRWGGVARRGTYRNPWKSASAKGICGPAPSEFPQASEEQGRNVPDGLAHG